MTKRKYLGGSTGVSAPLPLNKEETLYLDTEFVESLILALREKDRPSAN